MLEIFSAIIAAVGLVLAYIAIRVSIKIAKKSGAFDKANIDIYLGFKYIKLNKIENYIYYGFPFKRNSIGIVSPPLIIKNNGKKSIRNMRVKLETSDKWHLLVGGNGTTTESNGDILGIELDRKLYRISGMESSTSYVSRLDPNNTCYIGIPFKLTETQATSTATINNNVKVKYSIEWAVLFRLKINAEDWEEQVYPIYIQIIKAKNYNDLYSKFAMLQIEDAINKRESTSFGRFAVAALMKIKKRGILIYPQMDEIYSSKSNLVYQSDGMNDALYLIVYRPFPTGFIYRSNINFYKEHGFLEYIWNKGMFCKSSGSMKRR